ncbi:DNA-binding Lrp family transcriptional regulator [Arthrobacter stackebrandtii]|uniref:DNA-binding Lrp family transcriptional regulator n=1 Tax=Arthrobacter stackebrandtii TaxID=272161 RepID=A0ABS4YTS8_9MICC|nr:Lrp/AsnC family transcriptional regulator [Arthrobacter stackebrandtii]MBP2412191.1 DNA-binding Lrp family transcriptional regulator [Arthrobacter stackebrandtii]PYH01982.1 Lrp/AsnC family transcriptional regulator [Arthrobacter stackebrandtii]
MEKKQRAAAAPAGLDHTDLAILRALTADGGLTNKAVASHLGLAESTCANRLRLMRNSGVIIGNRITLNLAALGFPIQAVIKVRLGSHNAEHVNALYTALTQVPGVIHAFHVAGEDDFHLHVAVESPEALRDLVLKHVTVNRVVRQTETQLIFEARDGVGVLAN